MYLVGNFAAPLYALGAYKDICKISKLDLPVKGQDRDWGVKVAES